MPVLDSEANTGLTDELDVYGLDVDYIVDNVNVLDTIDANDHLQPEPDQHEEEALKAVKAYKTQAGTSQHAWRAHSVEYNQHCLMKAEAIRMCIGLLMNVISWH